MPDAAKKKKKALKKKKKTPLEGTEKKKKRTPVHGPPKAIESSFPEAITTENPLPPRIFLTHVQKTLHIVL